MFNSYDMTRAFVAERQQHLRHEARQHHEGRRHRRGRRATSTRPEAPMAAPVELPAQVVRDHRDRLAA